MRRRGALRALWAWMAAAAGVQGCGGGGGFTLAEVGSGGTGISPGVGSGGTGVVVSGSGAGPIEGFGSIIVNGTRWTIDGARLDVADIPELRLGATVQVDGVLSPDGTEGTASLVRSSADLRGPVASLDGNGASFAILGVTVLVHGDTVFAGGLRSAADLRVGDPLQVHGLPGAGGVLQATRVEKLAVPGTPVLVGIVQGLDALTQTFLLGTERVRYAGASFTGGWTTALQAGQAVRVRAGADGLLLQASEVEPWYSAPQAMPEGTVLTLGGVVSDPSGPASFRIDGVAVDATGAKVSGGPAAAVREGARVDVTGVLREGVLAASRIRIRRGAGADDTADLAAEATAFSARGSVGAYRSPASFKVQGQSIDASGAVFANGTAADLAPGRKVTVTGSRVVDDVLVAERVAFD